MSFIGTLHIFNQSYEKATVTNNKETVTNNKETVTNNDITYELTKENIGKAFHGDTVEISNNKIIKIINTDIHSKQIVGILVFETKYKYGYNKKHSEIFLFKPLNYHYPEFLVASKNRFNKNQYVIIQFLDWTNTLPGGQIVRIIGDIDNENNTYEAIIYKNNLNTIMTKYNKAAINPSNFDPLIFFDNIVHKKIDKYVFSVDPKGCEDIDDAFSIVLNKDYYTVDIHIADVSYYLDYFNIDIKRYSTIYTPTKNYNMLPDIFSNNICSLKENQNRLAFTVSVNINFNGKILDYSFEKTVIRSCKAYDYDELQELINNKEVNDELQLYNLGRIIYNKDNYNTHNMVEIFMIMANNLVAKYLYDNLDDKSKIIFRIHEKKNNNKSFILSNNKEINDILELLESNAAVYINSDSSNYYHHGLNIEYYTHFTSPIRRYIDIYIHKLLDSIINKNSCTFIQPDCDKINEFNKNIKKIERDFNKIRLANNFNNKELDAYILQINNNRITIYIPENKIIHQMKLIDHRLKELVNINYDGTKIEIKHKISNNSVTLNQYDMVKIKIVSKMYNDNIHKKIDIFIPEIQKLIAFTEFTECIENQLSLYLS